MRTAAALVALIVTLLFLTSAVIQPWNDPGSISLTVTRGPEGNNETVLVNYSISSSRYSDPIRIVLVPLDRYQSLPIYIFSEKDKYSLQDYSRVLGLYDHLRAQTKLSGLQENVELVDHQGALDVLKGGPSVLIIVNSTQDWSDESAAMLTWVENGGLIFGLGAEALPFVSASAGGTPDQPYRISYEALDYDGGAGIAASSVATALDFKYQSPRSGMKVDDVESYGQAIGYLYSREDNVTSAAMIHRGNGSIFLFSDVMEQPFTTSMEDAVSEDLVNILASGLPWESGPLFSTQINGTNYPLTGSFTTDMASSNLLSCYAFSISDHQNRKHLLVI